jgi:hypothetical protein
VSGRCKWRTVQWCDMENVVLVCGVVCSRVFAMLSVMGCEVVNLGVVCGDMWCEARGVVWCRGVCVCVWGGGSWEM